MSGNCYGVSNVDFKQVNIYFFKPNNGNARIVVEYVQSSQQQRQQNEVNNVILVCLMLTLNIFGT